MIAIARLTLADMAADSGVPLGMVRVRSSLGIRFPLRRFDTMFLGPLSLVLAEVSQRVPRHLA
ncbi:hypothetical protein [Lysobacter sp. Root96]|uniref:hypothetical protein n=1 Tax=Lysobacter sp. Root96 TaxID=1736612 RepID=UPI00138F75C0|nr:hypothetical protein [Lysobacter sp. Root96]